MSRQRDRIARSGKAITNMTEQAATVTSEPTVQTLPPEPVRQEEAAKPKPRKLPPFKVILHNDDENDMVHVIQAIRHLTPLSRTEAMRSMLEAHMAGCSLLLVTHRERAELYVEQFASYSLTVTAEPDG